MNRKDELKQQILALAKEYYAEVHGQEKSFEPGKTFVNYGGRYFDENELVNLVDSSLDFWLTAGPWARKFEKGFCRMVGSKVLFFDKFRFFSKSVSFFSANFTLIGGTPSQAW